MCDSIRDSVKIEEINELKNSLELSSNYFYISLFAAIVGVASLIFHMFNYNSDHTMLLSFGMMIGGGFVGCMVFYSKKEKSEKKLDELCYLKYGKSYNNSSSNILSDTLRYDK